VSAPQEPAAAVIARLSPAIMGVLDALEYAARHVAPDTLTQLATAMAGRGEALDAALAESRAMDWPDRWAPVRECLESAAEQASRSLISFSVAADDMRAAGRALRLAVRATEALYPLAGFMRGISAHFIEPAARGDPAIIARIAAAQPGRDGVGTLHLGGPPGTRGGASLYVPEYDDGVRSWPLVVALHGGSGNGGDFLWTWLRTARTTGCVLLAPTAIGETWSLTEPEIDGPNIARLMAGVTAQWRIDPRRMLLTGMSDGGTFCYSWGLGRDCPCTHLAPVAAGYHPFLMGFADIERLPGFPVRITHGARDWMFAATTAREAARTLRAAGANVDHAEIADLAHTYPREENAAILDWFLGTT